jgi:hypothetical protein
MKTPVSGCGGISYAPMSNLLFSVLYAACLAFCLGVVQALQYSWPAPPPEPEPQAVEEIIAMPPRPEGVRKVHGEGDEGYRYTEPGCREHDGQYRDICFHQLARQRATTDLPGGLAACALVEEADSRQECTADVAELYAPTDKAASLEVCPTIPRKKWRDQCVFGIALALSTTESRWAFATCDDAGKWRDFCRHDVNGEIAVVNVDLALEHCAAETGDLLTRKSCWHGIGTYISRVDPSAAFDACTRVPTGPDDLYVENCYHGVGWGASESAGAAFAADCARAGDKQDSCLLGIAYNLRRFDIDAGMGICARVVRADLKSQCERFVRDGTIQ